MTKLTHDTAPTQYIQAGGTRIAYRRFGARGEPPLLLLNYFAANMDYWDPAVTDGLAAAHDVILLDYPGVGGSSGTSPSTVAALTSDCAAFCLALGVTYFDVVGFSLGGMVAQQMAFDHPDWVRRVVLLGTAPRGGEGLVFDDLSIDELDDVDGLVMKAFFTQGEAGQVAGRAYIARIKQRREDRVPPVSKEAAVSQLAALKEWGTVPKSDRFAMLHGIRQPTLIVHGNTDIVVNPINALLLVQHLPDARLIVFPSSSHGAQSQYAGEFLGYVRQFFAS